MGDGFKSRIVCADCIEWLRNQREPFADLIFADPPFNIGYRYDRYHDSRRKDEYLRFSGRWIAACRRVLKPTGSFYIAIGDENAAEIKIIAERLGLHLRNWIIWHYSFGQATRRKFARSHTHIFYFVADAKRFTFNADSVRVPSDRQKQYNDKRAAAFGKVPDDVWDEFPRVCGTFAERQGWHPCQMPEALLIRIIRVSSNPGDVVLDPFCGSGTTLSAAAKLGRRFLGIDISPRYVAEARRRAEAARRSRDEDLDVRWFKRDLEELIGFYREAGLPLSRLLAERKLLEVFARLFELRLENGRSYSLQAIVEQLQHLLRTGRLPVVKAHVRESPELFSQPSTGELDGC